MENSFIDLVIRIKNGYMSKREQIIGSYSRFNEEILKVLKKLQYIKDYRTEGDIIKKISIDLLYKEDGPAVTGIKLVSKLGQRTYISYRKLQSVVGGMGFSILSTPKGILTNTQARKEKVGGELLFQIW